MTDSLGNTSSTTTQVTVANATPANLALGLAANPIFEMQQASLNGTFTDPGLLDTHSVSIDWGDGSQVTTLPMARAC